MGKEWNVYLLIIFSSSLGQGVTSNEIYGILLSTLNTERIC
jgi:hypothetical protein